MSLAHPGQLDLQDNYYWGQEARENNVPRLVDS